MSANCNSWSTIDRATLRSNTSRIPSGSGAPGISPGLATNHKRQCCDVHCNNLWSIWYGITVVLLEAFIVYRCVSRFLIYLALPWPERRQPYLELNAFVGLIGAGVVLLPFFFISFMFKIGNLANDGYKLGYHLSACPMDPPSIVAQATGFIRNAWHHGGPTAPFIHIVSAFCFILPKVIIEAKLIEVGFLSRDHLWKTDLDWLMPTTDRVVVLQFLNGGYINGTPTSTQAPFHHPAAQIRAYLEAQDNWWPCSPEFLNYALSLLVFSVRYPAVFWNTNKGLSFLFSLQLLANGLQHLMSLGGISVMYKVQMLGPQNVLHKYEPFLLNTPICMLLYILSSVIVTSSSCVFYMYAYQKFMSFVEVECEKHSICLREGRTSLWSYFPHCSAMCVLIALAVCNGPLLYDFTIIYKGSLDTTVLACVIATISHLFLWIVVWLFLTVKQHWVFKLRVSVGKAVVKQARSIKLMNDIELSNRGKDPAEASIMIIAFGKTFSVTDPAPKKLIMNTLVRAAIERDKAIEDNVENSQLLPLTSDDLQTPPQSIQNSTMSKQQKVTFEEHHALLTNSPRPSLSRATGSLSPNINQNPSTKLLNQLHNKDQLVSVYDEASKQADEVAELDKDFCDNLPPPPELDKADLTSPNITQDRMITPSISVVKRAQAAVHNPDMQDIHTPRSNRSVDSGLPHDDITPRSECLSTSSSVIPPEQAPSQSGMPLSQRELHQQHRKSTSLDDMNSGTNGGRVVSSQWKSYSLQRGSASVVGEAPPPVATIHTAAASNAAGTGSDNADGTLVIRRHTLPRPDEEDPYDRCTNMKLTSFTEQQAQQQLAAARDPRIIDLTQSTSTVSSTNSVCSTPRQGSPVQYPQNLAPDNKNFNTLPAHANCANGTMAIANAAHNTLPARFNGAPISASSARSAGPIASGPSGRHFKPFDHRKMNPMAEIQEDTTWSAGQTSGVDCSSTSNSLIVQKSTGHLPHLPSELRHTNYKSSSLSTNNNNATASAHLHLHQQTLVNLPLDYEHQHSPQYSMISGDSS